MAIPTPPFAERHRRRLTRLFNLGLSDEEIGRVLGFKRTTIIKYRILLRLLRTRGSARGRPYGPADIDRLACISDLRDQGLSYAEIGRRLGISRQAVHDYDRRWGGE